MLGHHWEKAEATVVDRTVRVQPAGYQPHYNFVVDVRPSSGPPVRVTVHDGPAGNFDDPSVGDVLGVLFDPKHQHVKWDLSDPRLTTAATSRPAAGSVQNFSGAAATEMLDTMSGPGGAGAIAAMRAGAGDHPSQAADPAARLARLQALRDSGVLTEAEYEAQRQKIISAI
jgi:hypothetical protein